MFEFNFQGFRIIGDKFKPIEAICQFKYKNHEVSISNMGVMRGACPTKIAVYALDKPSYCIGEFDSVEEAIEYIDNSI